MKLIYFTLVVLFCVVQLSSFVDAKSKKPKRPKDVDSHLFCETCKAASREMVKKINDSRSDIPIFEALDKLCETRSFLSYSYAPSDMVRGCKAFVELYEDKLTKALRQRKDNNDVEDKLCLELTDVCVNPGERQAQPEGTVEVNGVNTGVKISDALQKGEPAKKPESIKIDEL